MKDDVVFITGATGFVGSHLVRRCVRDRAQVHILCRSDSNFRRLRDVESQIRKHVSPLGDAQALRAILQVVRPIRIYHLAAATVVAGVTGSVAELIGVNALGTANLIEAAETVPYASLITTGDSFEYSASAAPLGEDGPCEPDSAHGITKLAATLHAQSVARARRRPIVTLRLFSTYGPGDNPRRLVPRIIEGAIRGTPIRLSRPEITRDWVYIDDVVDLYLEAAERASDLQGGVFNGGSGVGTPIVEIAERLLRMTASKTAPEWGVFPAPAHDDTPWVADMARTFGAFKWRPTTSLDEGLRATIAAIAEAPSW